MITTDIIKVISETAREWLIAVREKNHEDQVYFEAIHVVDLTDRAYQVVLALEKDVRFGIMNIPALIYPYAACYVSYVIAYNIHLQTVNALYRGNKSRQ